MEKKFPLRILNPKMYPVLEVTAKEKKWSVNSLINTALEEYLKKEKKKIR